MLATALSASIVGVDGVPVRVDRLKQGGKARGRVQQGRQVVESR